jgi:polygalacturonase
MNHHRFRQLVPGLLLLCLGMSVGAGDIPLPTIPDHHFNIVNYGAVGDGKTLNTVAIQKAIDACAAAGGGTVEVPAGNFVFGPIVLRSRLNLQLDTNAVLLIDNDMSRYPLKEKRYVDCLTAEPNAQDIEISGEGAIDGQGDVWWKAFIADLRSGSNTMPHRPFMIRVNGVTRLYVHGVTLRNSPMFHLATDNCTDVTIRGITISAPERASNTDGIDPSGWNYLITGCTIDTGDDNIAIKPTRGRTPGDKNFTVIGCTFMHGHGMSIGGGSFNGLSDLVVSNCTFNGSDAAIRIKTGRGNSGVVSNLVYRSLSINNVKNPIYINDYYPERNAPKNPADSTTEPVTERTPVNTHIFIGDVTITGCPNGGTIYGVPEMPISDVTFSNVTVSAKTGMKIYYANNVKFINSKITADAGKNLITYKADVAGLQ